MLKRYLRFLPLLIIAFIFALMYHYHIINYITFSSLQAHQQELLKYVHGHYFYAILLFSAVYVFAVAISLPWATILTLIGGFLFGNIVGTIVVVIAATLGATIIYLAVKLAFGVMVREKIASKAKFMEKKLAQNAFFYLLSLRFLPTVPFFLINLAAGVFNVKLNTFFFSTLFGIIPGTFVYVNIGASIGSTVGFSQSFNAASLVNPRLILAFTLLAIISLLPTFIKQYTKTKIGKGEKL